MTGREFQTRHLMQEIVDLRHTIGLKVSEIEALKAEIKNKEKIEANQSVSRPRMLRGSICAW
jgi:hypothetical protein